MYKNIVTPCGEVRGIIEEGIAKFKGIRYATSKRWAYPVLVKKWDGILNAFEYGDCCYQRRAIFDEEIQDSFYFREYRKGLKYTYSEDCLYLNVFTPEENFLNVYGNRLFAMHLHDNDGQSDLHLIPFSSHGTINWEEKISLLKNTKLFSESIVLEVETKTEGIDKFLKCAYSSIVKLDSI